MNKSMMMKRAHAIAKTLEGNYSVRLSIALKAIWAEVKSPEMIALVGSEKQVAWATEIRNNNIAVLKRELEDMKELVAYQTETFGSPAARCPEIVKELEKALSIIGKNKPEAKWWIENKGMAMAFVQRIKRAK